MDRVWSPAHFVRLGWILRDGGVGARSLISAEYIPGDDNSGLFCARANLTCFSSMINNHDLYWRELEYSIISSVPSGDDQASSSQTPTKSVARFLNNQLCRPHSPHRATADLKQAGFDGGWKSRKCTGHPSIIPLHVFYEYAYSYHLMLPVAPPSFPLSLTTPKRAHCMHIEGHGYITL